MVQHNFLVSPSDIQTLTLEIFLRYLLLDMEYPPSLYLCYSSFHQDIIRKLNFFAVYVSYVDERLQLNKLFSRISAVFSSIGILKVKS